MKNVISTQGVPTKKPTPIPEKGMPKVPAKPKKKGK